MNVLNNMMNELMHEKELAALSATCHVSNGECSGAYSFEDSASECYLSSYQLNV